MAMALKRKTKIGPVRGHVLTGNEYYTINIVYVIVDMLLQWALTMNDEGDNDDDNYDEHSNNDEYTLFQNGVQ